MLPLLRATLASALLCVLPFSGLAEEFRDNDWNTGFYDNCGLPCGRNQASDLRPASADWVTDGPDRKLAITLMPGDVGGCRSDDSPRDGAPYWERAELVQYTVMEKGQRHVISFDAEFDQGFTGRRETFFQIHGWSKTCNSAPLLMLQWDWRTLRALVLAQSPQEIAGKPATQRGHLQSALTDAPQLADLLGRTNSFDIQFDRTTSPETLTVVLNGHVLLNGYPVHVIDCAEPRIKIGIYRPGQINPVASRLLIDRVRLDGASEPTCPVPADPDFAFGNILPPPLTVAAPAGRKW